MKNLITIIVLLLLGIEGYAAEAYVVTSKSLNMRAKPQNGAKKLGSLQQGAVVSVDTIINGWATCLNEAGETFYVSSKYLEKGKSLPAAEENKKPAVDEKDPAVIVQKQVLEALSSVGIHIEQSKSTRYFEYMLFMPLIVAGACWLLSLIMDKLGLGQYAILIGLAFLGYLELKCMLGYSGSPGFFVHDEMMSILFWMFALSILFIFQSIFFGYVGIDDVRTAECHVGSVTVFGCATLYLITFLIFSALQPWILLLFFFGIALHLVLMFLWGDKSVKGVLCFAVYAVLYAVSALAIFLFMVMFIGHIVYLMGWFGSILFILFLLACGGGGGLQIIGIIVKA